jgi:hypothetical protein
MEFTSCFPSFVVYCEKIITFHITSIKYLFFLTRLAFMQNSYKISVFHERIAPEEGLLVGYGAFIHAFGLRTTLPDRLSLISDKHKQYETPQWIVFSPRYLYQYNFYDHLTFALKNEGIDLLVLKALLLKSVKSL